jgi:hypothetical protein
MYTLSRTTFFIKDAPRDISQYPESTLETLFRDSLAMFKIRVHHLGNHRRSITDADSEALRIMLETLITAKKELQ